MFSDFIFVERRHGGIWPLGDNNGRSMKIVHICIYLPLGYLIIQKGFRDYHGDSWKCTVP